MKSLLLKQQVFLHAFEKGGGKQADLNDFEIFDFRWKRWSTVLRGGQMLWAGWSASPGQVVAPYTTHAGGMSSAALSKVTHLEDGGKAQQCIWQVQRYLRSTGDSIQMQNYRCSIPLVFQCLLWSFQAERAEPRSPSFTACSRLWMKLLERCCLYWLRSRLLFLATGMIICLTSGCRSKKLNHQYFIFLWSQFLQMSNKGNIYTSIITHM